MYPEDHLENYKPYNIQANDPQKRMRVLEGWLLDDIIEDLKLTNYNFHVKTFMKQCSRFGKSYPIHEELHYIDKIRFEFWARVQKRYKELKAEKIRLVKIKRRLKIIRDLIRMRFLPC